MADTLPLRQRWAQRLRRLLPDTLSGQLMLILIVGLLGAQAITGTIWHDMRRHQALEVPTRIVAVQVGELLWLADHGHLDADLAQALRRPDFDFIAIDGPSSVQPHLPPLTDDSQALMRTLVDARVGRQVPLQLVSLRLPDLPAVGGLGHTEGLLGSLAPAGEFVVQAQRADGTWLSIRALANQGWHVEPPAAVFWDYFVRIYLVRILLLVAITLFAVRYVVRPINQLGEAAQALGHDLQRPPLPLKGPVEARRAAAAFNAMQQRLTNYLGERTRFLAAVSHDLRSPITRLRLRAELLPDSALKEKFRDDLAQMESLVSATLDFLHSGASGEPTQRIDLDSLLQSIASDLEDTGRTLSVTGHSTHAIPGYPRSLKRCLDNLIENALRYGEQASVHIADLPALQATRITVHDAGPGIPPELFEQVLEPFFRAEPSRNRATGGYGLGLSIAHAIVQAHHGSLAFRHPAEGGFDVIVTLPWQPAATEPAAKA